MKELTYEELQELEEYVQLDGTEIGEYLNLLLLLTQSSNYRSSDNDKFKNTINEELEWYLQDFRTNYKIVEESVTQPDKVYKSLEYIG